MTELINVNKKAVLIIILLAALIYAALNYNRWSYYLPFNQTKAVRIAAEYLNEVYPNEFSCDGIFHVGRLNNACYSISFVDEKGVKAKVLLKWDFTPVSREYPINEN